MAPNKLNRIKFKNKEYSTTHIINYVAFTHEHKLSIEKQMLLIDYLQVRKFCS